MRQSGKCPKCGSSEVYSNRHMGRWVRGGSYWSNTIPVTGMSNGVLENYICTDCGYMEVYLAEPDKLNKVRKQWTRVNPGYERVTSGPTTPCPTCGVENPTGWKACPHCGQPLV